MTPFDTLLVLLGLGLKEATFTRPVCGTVNVLGCKADCHS